jgi:hypothetical protein
MACRLLLQLVVRLKDNTTVRIKRSGFPFRISGE